MNTGSHSAVGRSIMGFIPLSRSNCPTANRWSFISAGTTLSIALFTLQVVLFEVLRLCLYWRNRDLAAGCDLGSIMRAFLFGLRFDMAMAAYTTLPLLLLSRFAILLWGTAGERRVYVVGSCAIGIVSIVLGVAELEFYHELSSRFNRIAVEYMSHPVVVSTMIWCGFPVIRYLAVAAAIVATYGLLVVKLTRRFLPATAHGSMCTRQFCGLFLSVTLLVIAARGGWQRKPLQWGDAIHSKSVFANHLAQNGIWLLSRDLFCGTGHNGRPEQVVAEMPAAEARTRVQQLLRLPDQDWADALDCYPILRQSRCAPRSVTLNRTAKAPPNVILIMMESFSARFVGAVGADNDQTPCYDRLAADGILFDRFFSNGTRTHQAHYTTMASFPNLPTTEWLMQDNLGNQPFDSLPAAMKRLGYQTIYIHNGHLNWDNVQGFFKFQGIDRFIGRDHFDPKKYFVGTWGVLDNVLFERANRIFAEAQVPFYATIMTATNHVPFECPRPYPFAEVTDAGQQNDRLNGVRFSDWSLGQFFEMACKENYFNNTLFVILGDHGVNTPPVLSEVHLLHHHVPLLFYAPSLLRDQQRRIHTVASQLDITPTILGLLDDTAPHQHWGRDLFALPDGDEGFAWLKTTGDPNLGLVRGDVLLVKTPDKSKMYHYDLGFPPHATEIDSPALGTLYEMNKDLQAYVQTALEVLRARHAAPRESGTTAMRSVFHE